MLIKALIVAVFHEAGVGVGEVVLIVVVGSGARGLRG
jgi:microcompartment protein CcmK/EutM